MSEGIKNKVGRRKSLFRQNNVDIFGLGLIFVLTGSCRRFSLLPNELRPNKLGFDHVILRESNIGEVLGNGKGNILG